MQNKDKSKSEKNRLRFPVLGVGALLIAVGAITFIPNKGEIILGQDGENKDNLILTENMSEADVVSENSPITGLPCQNSEAKLHRPIAVMLSGDDEVRPLSGIDRAELVIEMPVVTWGVNRIMAVYTCGGDIEVGSIRSSRDDFIPLVSGMDAIYGHWGGSYLALRELNAGVVDNIDALQNTFGAYYRKKGIPAPDNGFTTIDALISSAEQLGYDTEAQEEPIFVSQYKPTAPETEQIITIGYPGAFEVEWEYDIKIQKYLRYRGSRPEKDAVSGEQVSAGTVVVMETDIFQRYGEYNDVRVTGEGAAKVYRFGETIYGTWKKGEALDAKLSFVGEDGEIIAFAPGPVWIEIIQQDTPVTDI